jgi:hypothetical protein
LLKASARHLDWRCFERRDRLNPDRQERENELQVDGTDQRKRIRVKRRGRDIGRGKHTGLLSFISATIQENARTTWKKKGEMFRR